MTDAPAQLTRADLTGMSARQIEEARRAGRLSELLSLGAPLVGEPGKLSEVRAGTAPEADRAGATPAGAQLVRPDLSTMTAQEIEAARRAGRLRNLLAGA